jgi:ABC-type phosphate transport system substrate-binding protein
MRPRVLLLALALVSCCCVALVGGQAMRSVTYPPGSPIGAYSTFQRRPLEFTVLTTSDSTTWVTSAAQQYSIFRPDVKIIAKEIPASSTQDSATQAHLAIGRAEGDFAITSFRPTAASATTFPDLVYIPFFSTALGPIVNVPEAGGDFILDLFTLGRIFTGNVTMWNESVSAVSASR